MAPKQLLAILRHREPEAETMLLVAANPPYQYAGAVFQTGRVAGEVFLPGKVAGQING